MQERHFQRFLHSVPSTGEPFNLQALFLNLILDLTTAFALGESADSLSPTQSNKKKHFVHALLYVKKIMARDGFLGPVHKLLSKRNFYRACSDVHRYVKGEIESALKKKRQQSKDSNQEMHTESFNLLQALTDNTNKVSELRDGVITVLIAGIDSVASLLSTTFWLLARDVRVFKKLQTAVLDSVRQDVPSYDQLKSLTYLRYVFQEGQTCPVVKLLHPVLTPTLIQ